MHKNNLALETDCTWGVPIVESVSSKKKEEKPAVMTSSEKPMSRPSCIKRDQVWHP